MIASLFMYALAAGTCAAVAAWLLDGAARVVGLPRRWGWLMALVGTAMLIFSASVRRPEVVEPVRQATSLPVARPISTAERAVAALMVADRARAALGRVTNAPRDFMRTSGSADAWRWVGFMWVGASMAALLVLLLVHRRLASARRRWPVAHLFGVRVRIAPSAGPAVIGIADAEIVVPRWLTLCASTEQRMVVEHEREHLEANDAIVLAIGFFSAVMAPWHPAVWWMLQRLRLAVELDCDARVLKAGVDRAAYGELLIGLAGRRTGFGIAAFAPAFPQRPSQLERRLNDLGATRRPFAEVKGAALAAAAAMVAVLMTAVDIPAAVHLTSLGQARFVATPATGNEYQPASRERPDSATVMTSPRTAVSRAASTVFSSSGAIRSSTVPPATPEAGSETNAPRPETPVPGSVTRESRVLATRSGQMMTPPAGLELIYYVDGAVATREDVERLQAAGEIASVDVVSGRDGRITMYVTTKSASKRSPPTLVLDGRTLSGVLMVIDDVIQGPETTITALSHLAIESVEVIKGREAERLYGARAARGVVIVRTKGRP